VVTSIPRDAGVSTTQAFYILPNRGRAEAGRTKLDKTLSTKYGIKAWGPVAQRLERPAHNRQVPGSNPGGPTILNPSHLLVARRDCWWAQNRPQM
jgi:hypothetical protein